MKNTATLRIGSENHHLPLFVGTEGEVAVDCIRLREITGAITLDEGYANTGSCLSEITFINGEKGILRHRGYPIEELAQASTFLETAYLVIYGSLPNKNTLTAFQQAIESQSLVHTGIYSMVSTFPRTAHPMGMLASLVQALGSYYPDLGTNDRKQDIEQFDAVAVVLMSQIRSLAALSMRHKLGLPPEYLKPHASYVDNFLHGLFSLPHKPYHAHPDVQKAFDLILLLHVDHEQNCSTSTVRMVASGCAHPFAAVSAGISALWGPLHGGANMAVIQMLQAIHDSGDDGHRFIDSVKAGSGRLMGFGHRVYKNYDPRAKILRAACERVLKVLGQDDPLLAIATRLEEEALRDDYFIERKLYPNVDFYSGIILRAIGIPLDLFTVIFAIGRMPGWLANWREMAMNPKPKIYRPRQIYIGPTQRLYVPLDARP